METQVIEILKILIGIGATSIVGLAIKEYPIIRKFIVSKIGEQYTEDIEKYTLKVVSAIAQKYVTLSNEEKFAKAIALLEAKYGVNFLSESELEVLIEDAVAQLKLAQNLPVNQPIPVAPTK